MSNSTTQHVTLNAPDINCNHCVGKIRNAAGSLYGVATVEADPATKLVTVAFNPDQVSLGQIAAALGKAGFPVTKA